MVVRYSREKGSVMHFRNSFLFISSLFAVAFPPVVIAESNSQDVLGVSTGMGLDEADLIIKNNFPNLKRKSIKNHLGKEYGFTYSINPNESGRFQITIAYTSSNKVYFIGQAKSFDATEQPSFTTVRKQFSEKYGEPTTPLISDVPETKGRTFWRPEYMAQWSFNENNNLIRIDGQYSFSKDPCSDFSGGMTHSQTIGINLDIPATVPSPTKCKRQIKTIIRMDYYTRRVSSFSIGVTDTDLIFKDKILGESSRALFDRQEKIKKNTSSDPKIKL